MGTQSTNPLAGFFRQPVIHLKLPSNGQYWDDNALSLPVTGEIPIYPMTTKDEITLRTPDALLNGSSVVSVISSCCPNILDPWNMPSIDVDAVLIAIRIASYGSKMEIETKCPHCQEENTYEINLNNVLAEVKVPNYNEPAIFNGLKIKFRPQKYFSVNKTNQEDFEEQKILQAVSSTSMTVEEKTAAVTEHMKRLVDLNLKIMIDSTESIITPTGQVVTEAAFINEFYQNADRNVQKTVRNWLENAASVAAIKPVKVSCADCTKDFNVAITFDYANFFA